MELRPIATAPGRGPRKPCRDGAECRKPNCQFIHPPEHEAVAACIPCVNAFRCRKANCRYMHPAPPIIAHKRGTRPVVRDDKTQYDVHNHFYARNTLDMAMSFGPEVPRGFGSAGTQPNLMDEANFLAELQRHVHEASVANEFCYSI